MTAPTAHVCERPYEHSPGCHRRQAEPVSLCEAVAALVCATDALKQPALAYMAGGLLDFAALHAWVEGRRILAQLAGVMAAEATDADIEGWITMAEGYVGIMIDIAEACA